MFETRNTEPASEGGRGAAAAQVDVGVVCAGDHPVGEVNDQEEENREQNGVEETGLEKYRVKDLVEH